MSRTTKVKHLFAVLAKELCEPTTLEQAQAQGFPRYLKLDYAPSYGGYILEWVDINTFSTSNAFGSNERKSRKEMEAFLNGLLEGFSMKRPAINVVEVLVNEAEALRAQILQDNARLFRIRALINQIDSLKK